MFSPKPRGLQSAPTPRKRRIVREKDESTRRVFSLAHQHPTQEELDAIGSFPMGTSLDDVLAGFGLSRKETIGRGASGEVFALDDPSLCVKVTVVEKGELYGGADFFDDIHELVMTQRMGKIGLGPRIKACALIGGNQFNWKTPASFQRTFLKYTGHPLDGNEHMLSNFHERELEGWQHVAVFERPQLVIVMERATEIADKAGKIHNIDERLVHFLLYAYASMRVNNICHNDLKLDNIGLMASGEWRLIDFGLTGFCDPLAKTAANCEEGLLIHALRSAKYTLTTPLQMSVARYIQSLPTPPLRGHSFEAYRELCSIQRQQVPQELLREWSTQLTLLRSRGAKKGRTRKCPQTPATHPSMHVGKKKKGADGKMWKVAQRSSGRYWAPCTRRK